MLRKKINGVVKGFCVGFLFLFFIVWIMDCCQFLVIFGVVVGGMVVLLLMINWVQVVMLLLDGGEVVYKKLVCIYCLVGCIVEVEVQNGVWIGQELGWDSFFNMGVYCVKGVVVCEYVYNECCLKYLMKMVDGQWQKIFWDQVINEIGDKMLQICEESGFDFVYWLGSVKFNNEQVYFYCKFVVYWGINNVDYQVCICYFIIVVGVVNIWGYGVMINFYNDIYKFKVIFLIGGNLVEVYLVLLLYIFKVKE